MDFTLELVCPARGSFSLSTKVLSIHVIVNQLSEKAKPFPSTRVTLSFSEKTISVNNGVIHKKRHKVNQRGGNNIPVNNIIY